MIPTGRPVQNDDEECAKSVVLEGLPQGQLFTHS